MNFEFATASRIIFGSGKLYDLRAIVAEMGTRVLVITATTVTRSSSLLELLDEGHIPYSVFQVTEEPSVELVQAGIKQARQADCDLVIAMGGGSVIDTGKAIAALATNAGEPLDYLEVIGKGQPLTQPPLPVIAIPTTAGTGAEVTRNAVLASHEHKVKVSLRSPLMLPRVALVDPELTYSVPPNVTAYTGMDALTQVLEPYVTHLANPLTDSLCREGMARAARSLRRAYDDGEDNAAREDMALTSLFGGLALANAKLGAVHGFAGPLGGMYHAPHGAVCARLLPFVTEVNVHALRDRDPHNRALERYDEIGQILTGTPGAEQVVAWVHELGEALEIPPLGEYGVTRAAIPEIVEKSARSSSMKGNPITLTHDELAGILEQAL
ncbi:MAG: iron-containing alcohol dehydrogenase [Anaerolineae bacterium]|nr:iron-containing alcohol dehydrogenase [Anaerolineae bacterium]